jgi:hypothetical protein
VWVYGRFESMTLSAPPEQTLREPVDRPVQPPSRRIAGIFMVITFDVARALVAAP